MKTRILSVLLVLCLFAALLPGGLVSAAEPESDTWFYSQLTDPVAQAVYHGLEEMESKGLLKTGIGAYDLTTMENGVPAADVAAYLNGTYVDADGKTVGTNRLLAAYGEGRDAYYMDHPDVFYVDFSNLTVNITRVENEHHLVLASGRYENYYTQGFTSEDDVKTALADYETALSEAVAAADGANTDAEKVRAVHDYITHHTTYRTEDKVSPENIGFIRTAYGALVKHEGVCEAYTRAMKAAMDRLGIPCVMVSGVYLRSDGTPESHIWDYVQIDGAWYMVDATMDDPTRPDGKTEAGVEGFESSEYLLVGARKEAHHHLTNGAVSPAGMEFSYPALSAEDYGVESIGEAEGLHVRFSKTEMEGGEDAGKFAVDYNGMSAIKLREQGLYMVTKMYWEVTEVAEDGSKQSVFKDSGWVYLIPEIYSDPAMKEQNPFFTDNGTETVIALPQVKYIQFGVTDIPVDQALIDYLYDKDKTKYGRDEVKRLLDAQYYTGDAYLLLAESQRLENPYGDYKAPPYVVPSNDGANTRLYIEDGAQRVSVTFDDDLELMEGYDEPSISFTSRNNTNLGDLGTTGEQYSTLENFSWDGRRTVEFDFTPSPMYADDSIAYEFTLHGLVGVNSGKEPNSFGFPAVHRCAIYMMQSAGFDYNVYGKPVPLDDEVHFDENWLTSDGETLEGFDDSLSHRMMLVVDNVYADQQAQMDGLLQEAGEPIKGSQSYNINLTICKKYVIKTGDSIRVMLGFPDGYGPEDEGVTFKAYHFSKDASGRVIGVNEIPCVVTKYGLLVYCDSFSPFTIAAVESDGQIAEQSYVLAVEGGGSVQAAQNSGTDSTLIRLAPGEETNVTATAKDGFVISGVTVGEQPVEVPITDGRLPTTFTFPLTYPAAGTASAEAPVVKVSFIAEAAAQAIYDETGGIVEAMVPSESEDPQEPSGGEPSTEPTASPAPQEPTAEPTASPAPQEPTAEPSASPAPQEPTAEPTASPAPQEPTAEPTASPAPQEPAGEEPTAKPTASPEPEESEGEEPEAEPTANPTPKETPVPGAKTGDTRNLLPFFVLGSVAIAGLAGVGVAWAVRKRR